MGRTIEENREYHRKYYKTPKHQAYLKSRRDIKNKLNKAFYWRHKVEILSKNKTRYNLDEEYRNKMKRGRAKYYRKHRDMLLKKSLEYCRSHPEIHRAASNKYHNSEKGKLSRFNERKSPLNKIRQKRYSDTPLGRANRQAHQRNYRAKKNGQENKISRDKIKELIMLYDNRCVYCNDKLDSPHIDHVIPLSRNGKHVIENLVPACQRCNSQKGNKSLLMFLMYRKKYITGGKPCAS